QVHFLWLIAPASLFTVGAAHFIFDFFRHAPRFEIRTEDDAARDTGVAAPLA
ncbi:MAG: nitric-oxide reductase large subunit, partial [Gammaproteobacteria bacterium]